jgi:hypothetical protein
MLELLKTAVKRIDGHYFDRNERDFSYELYHQIRLLKLPIYTEVTCETSKKRFNYNDGILDDNLIKRHFFSDETNGNRKIFRYPDLLIHEYENRNQQLLAIEIKKRVVPNDIKRDLAKLIVYCRGRLKYKNGVIIIVKPLNINRIIEMPDIREMLRRYPEVQIWSVEPELIQIYNSTNL